MSPAPARTHSFTAHVPQKAWRSVIARWAGWRHAARRSNRSGTRTRRSSRRRAEYSTSVLVDLLVDPDDQRIQIALAQLRAQSIEAVQILHGTNAHAVPDIV